MSVTSPGKNRWFSEALTPDLLIYHSLKAILYAGRTRYQSVEVLETSSFGRTLVLDGKTQSAEADEFIYHESLVNPAMLLHPRPTRVLIAGGGEGATLREVLGHTTVEQAVMVDIDSEVVELSQRLLPNHHQGAFQDPRARLHFADAREFLRREAAPFDVIVLDLPDPLEGGPAALLYTREFYALVRERLSEGGIVVTQAESCRPGHNQCLTAVHSTLRSLFPVVCPYLAHVPSFANNWSFVLASLGPNPRDLAPEAIDRRIAERLRRPLRYYDGTTHTGLFSLPKYLREAMSANTRVITDANPLYVF